MTAKSKPILFTGEMVRAILDGRKTQTRRVLKSAFPRHYPEPVLLVDDENGTGGFFNDPNCWGYPCAEDGVDMSLADWANNLCPYGSIGGYLWVRENFCIADLGHGKLKTFYAADGDRIPDPWKPSIHMPRKLSRITLQITDIRVQRVQDITEQDSLAEGITLPLPESYAIDCAEKICGAAAMRSEFKRLWDSINGDRGYPWDLNPWVWAITFKPIMANIDDVLAGRL